MCIINNKLDYTSQKLESKHFKKNREENKNTKNKTLSEIPIIKTIIAEGVIESEPQQINLKKN